MIVLIRFFKITHCSLSGIGQAISILAFIFCYIFPSDSKSNLTCALASVFVFAFFLYYIGDKIEGKIETGLYSKSN